MLYRSNEQAEFAQRVKTHIVNPDGPLLLEGATGLGKTRAYLHPLFESNKHAAICLATGELICQLENSSDIEWAKSLFPDRSVATFRSKRYFTDKDGVFDTAAFSEQKNAAMAADIMICTASSVIYDQRLQGVYNGVTDREVIVFDEADQIPGLAALSSDLSITRPELRDLGIQPSTPLQVAEDILAKTSIDTETRAKARIIKEVAKAEPVWYRRVGLDNKGGVAVIHRLPGRLLKKIANRPSTIFVSATLSVNGKFNDFIRSMGITEQSPHYAMIEPEHHGDVYFSFATEHEVESDEWLNFMVDEINGADGLTLVVTPSHALAEKLGELVGDCIWRRRDETTREAYERMGNAKALIVAGAWAGLDVPRQWDTIVVPRIPFSPPKELFENWDEELEEHLRIGDPMTSYLDSKNTAARRMVQVLGRGLRHPDAKLCFVIGDHRIAQLGDFMPGRFHRMFFEGRSIERVVSSSERNPAVRREALRERGSDCEACGHKPKITLREVEVHHTSPLADNGPTQTDVRHDVLVLCRICHARAHKSGNNDLLGLEYLKRIAEDEKAEEFDVF